MDYAFHCGRRRKNTGAFPAYDFLALAASGRYVDDHVGGDAPGSRLHSATSTGQGKPGCFRIDLLYFYDGWLPCAPVADHEHGFGVWQTALVVGLIVPILPGASLAAAALNVGAIINAAVVYLFVRPILSKHYQTETPEGQTISWRRLLRFFIPLALSTLIVLATRPIISVGLARAPFPLESLAVLPGHTGISVPLLLHHLFLPGGGGGTAQRQR